MRFGQAMGLTSPTGIPKPDVTNHEGHPAFRESLRQTVANLALTGVLGDQFYTPETKQIDDLVQVCRDAAQMDPDFLVRAARVSRRANFKLFPKLAVAALVSTLGDDAWKEGHFEVKVVDLLKGYAPGQLLELALTFKGKVFGKGLGRRAQRVIGQAMVCNAARRLDEWTLSDREDVRRLLRLVHPVGFSDEQVEALAYALGDGADQPKTTRQIGLYALKVAASAGCADELLAETITVHRLPFNATKGIAGNRGPEVWRAIRDQMSPLQVMLNLKSLDEKGVITPAELERFLGAVDTGKTRLVPHDVLRPFAHAPGKFQDPLVRFLAKLASRPLPGLEGKRVGVSLDCSGSMYEQNDSVPNWMLAVTLATPILASCPDRVLSFFHASAFFEGHNYPGGEFLRGNVAPDLKGMEPASTMLALLKLRYGGSTDIGSAIRLYSQAEIKLDVLFLFTDEQENAAIYGAKSWATYRAHVNPKAQLVVVNVSNAKWHAFKDGTQGVTIIQSVTPLVYEQLQRYDQSPTDLIESTALIESMAE